MPHILISFFGHREDTYIIRISRTISLKISCTCRIWRWKQWKSTIYKVYWETFKIKKGEKRRYRFETTYRRTCIANSWIFKRDKSRQNDDWCGLNIWTICYKWIAVYGRWTCQKICQIQKLSNTFPVQFWTQWKREYTAPVYQLTNSRPRTLLRYPHNDVTTSTHQNTILTKYQQFQIDAWKMR